MKKNLTRADLAQAVFEDLGLSFCESERLVDDFFEQIIQAFERGEDVKISSFGSFYLKNKKQRMGRNPKTGQEYAIAPHRSISFVPSQALKESVETLNLKKKDE